MSFNVVANFVSGLKFTLQGSIIIFFRSRYYNANIAHTALNTVMPGQFKFCRASVWYGVDKRTGKFRLSRLSFLPSGIVRRRTVLPSAILFMFSLSLRLPHSPPPPPPRPPPPPPSGADVWWCRITDHHALGLHRRSIGPVTESTRAIAGLTLSLSVPASYSLNMCI